MSESLQSVWQVKGPTFDLPYTLFEWLQTLITVEFNFVRDRAGLQTP